MKEKNHLQRLVLPLVVTLGLSLAFGQFANGTDAETKRLTIALLPIKGATTEHVNTVKRSIESSYGFKVAVLGASTLPPSSWYKPRKRHRAEKVLDWLHGKRPSGIDHIMAVTTKDISTTAHGHTDWGICGLAEMPGRAAVISTFRLNPKKKKRSPKERKLIFLKRLKDLAIHELGHNLGLPHCPQKGCFMEDAKGTVTTFDQSTGKLCQACRQRLEQK